MNRREMLTLSMGAIASAVFPLKAEGAIPGKIYVIEYVAPGHGRIYGYGTVNHDGEIEEENGETFGCLPFAKYPVVCADGAIKSHREYYRTVVAPEYVASAAEDDESTTVEELMEEYDAPMSEAEKFIHSQVAGL